MDFSNLKNKLLICLCCVVVILPFYLITFTYATEDTVIIGTEISGLDCNASRNYFTASSGGYITYYPVRKGYIYTVTQIHTQNGRASVYSSVFPEANVVYDLLYAFNGEEDDGTSFEYLCTTDGYLSINGYTLDSYLVTERPVSGQVNAISDLVENVGISSIWNIFDISINYIVVVVLFAFGAYIIFRIIRKISRGKEGL